MCWHDSALTGAYAVTLLSIADGVLAFCIHVLCLGLKYKAVWLTETDDLLHAVVLNSQTTEISQNVYFLEYRYRISITQFLEVHQNIKIIFSSSVAWYCYLCFSIKLIMTVVLLYLLDNALLLGDIFTIIYCISKFPNPWDPPSCKVQLQPWSNTN